MRVKTGNERNAGGLAAADKSELAGIVCDYFCRGYSPSQIADLVREQYGLEMSRETPYKFLRYAATRKWLRYYPPEDGYLARSLKERCRALEEAHVVHTALTKDVASHAAVVLMRMLRRYAGAPSHKQEVHLGLGGGFSMRALAEGLAERIRGNPEGLPKTIVFHALVAGFDLDTPYTDPNGFFTYFADPPAGVDVRFVALHAPAIVMPEQLEGLLALPGIREAHERVAEIDVIVTSAGAISDEHSMLSKYYSRFSRETLARLHEDGCEGDLLWMPVGRGGPLDCSRYPHRAMTLVELSELPRMIRRGVKVLLALGPCNICARCRFGVLNCLLGLKEPLITHLVVDTRTADAILNRGAGA